MKRVLFITYYWPPSGKASLHFPLGLIKHLPKFNWEPMVLTVAEDSFTKKDESLKKEISPSLKVCKSKNFEVFDFYKKFVGKKKEESLSVSEVMSKEGGWKQRFSLWVRMNLFIPDARVTWYFTAVKDGLKFINDFDGNIDAVISVGTPHSTHLIGRKIAKHFNTKHLTVFTDPWTSISYYNQFSRNWFSESLDHYFERKVLKDCSRSIFVTENTRQEYVEKYPFLKDKSDVLYWGFNEEKFVNLKATDLVKNSEILVHSGNLFDYQNPIKLWQTLKLRKEKGINLKLIFTGTVGPQIIKSIKENDLEDNFNYIGFLEYSKLLETINEADYLLMCTYDKRHVPGKLFEYLRIGKPIIAFGENDEIENLLSEAKAGRQFSYAESGEEFFDHLSEFKTDQNIVKKYDRFEITKKLSTILNNLE